MYVLLSFNNLEAQFTLFLPCVGRVSSFRYCKFFFNRSGAEAIDYLPIFIVGNFVW
jgi:hypothetical protein